MGEIDILEIGTDGKFDAANFRTSLQFVLHEILFSSLVVVIVLGNPLHQIQDSFITGQTMMEVFSPGLLHIDRTGQRLTRSTAMYANISAGIIRIIFCMQLLEPESQPRTMAFEPTTPRGEGKEGR